MSRANKSMGDLIEQFHGLGLYLPNRIVDFTSDASGISEDEAGVDFRLANRTVRNLLILDTMASDPITMIINNPGGDVLHGMAVYDAINHCRSEVRAVVYGSAMSMAAIILQAADERLMAPNAKLMIHIGEVGAEGNPRTVKHWVAEYDRIDKWMVQVLLEQIQKKHPHFKKQRLQRMLEHDTILSAQEAVDLGLADGILE